MSGVVGFWGSSLSVGFGFRCLGDLGLGFYAAAHSTAT